MKCRREYSESIIGVENILTRQDIHDKMDRTVEIRLKLGCYARELHRIHTWLLDDCEVQVEGHLCSYKNL